VRARVRVPWGLAALGGVLAIVDTAFTAARTSMLSHATLVDHGWPAVSLTTLSCSVMGALVVSRYPRHPIGWLLMVAGLSSISISSEAYSLWALDGSGHGPALAGHVAGWVSGLFGAPLAMTAVVVIFLIAPDGRFLSRRWRWVAMTAAFGLVSYTAAVATLSPTDYVIDTSTVGPGLNALAAVGILLMILTLVAATVCLVIRLRRAQGETRRQLLWIAASASLLAFAFVWFLTVQRLDRDRPADVSVLFLYLAYLSLPSCIAVAVLRHRLVDIDVIVNRALVVFLATALVGATYVLVVVGLGSLLGDQVGYWPSLLTTAVVALAFQPARQWVVRVADRLAFGAAAEPYDALAEFSRRLGESPDPSDLLPAVAEAAAGAVGARRVVVTLALPSGADRFVVWPPGSAAGAGPTADIPISGEGEALGSLHVEMAPGRAGRARDTALLTDFADQAVVAFRNARLSAELTHRVEELDEQAGALEASRHRLITADDAERSRLERAVTREVAPHLQDLPAELEQLAAGGRGPVTVELVRALRTEAEAALEALREITRGVYPAQLGRTGLEPALRSLLARRDDATLTVADDHDLPRSDPRVEAAAYFCVSEAVRDLGGPVEVSLVRHEHDVCVCIDGQDGGELPLDNMRDRAEALGGTITSSARAGRVSLEVSLPAVAAVQVPAQRAASSEAARA
jgi:signal transduction histidine kinase